MSDRYFQILKDSNRKGNCIPSGRQLPRTPPFTDVRRHLDFCSEDADYVATQTHSGDQGNRMFNSPQTKQAKNTVEAPDSMLKGMKGYQLTPEDEEFIKKMMMEKEVKKLQRDLEELQKLLKREAMAFEITLASKEKVQATLNQLPSCEELTEWAKVVLEMTSPLTESTDLDAKSLLAAVTKENAQRAIDEKRAELGRMEKMVEIKRRKEAKERGQLEKRTADERLKIQRLMGELSDLKSKLARQEEASRALEMQMSTKESPKIKVKAEGGDTPEEPQAASSQVKQKDRKRAVKSAEKLQNATNQSKPTRNNRKPSKTDAPGSLKDNANKTFSTPTTEETKPKPGTAAEKPTKSVKAARGRQKKEEQESGSQESTEAVRGRRKPPGSAQTTVSQPKNQRKVKTVETQPTSQSRAPVAAEDEGRNTGLRRSKRIASKK